jgi:hypothetical protein
MKRVSVPLFVFSAVILVATLIRTNTSNRNSFVHPPIESGWVPAGATVRVRLIENISSSSGVGDILPGVIADPVQVNSRVVVPANARASVAVVQIERQRSDAADVTLQLKELLVRDGNVAMKTESITQILTPTSEVDDLVRGVAAIIGSAIGAAGNVSIRGNPNIGAASVGGLAPRSAPEGSPQPTWLFKITEPLDLTDVRW